MATVTAATALVVAAVTAVSASVALATGGEQTSTREFSVQQEPRGTAPAPDRHLPPRASHSIDRPGTAWAPGRVTVPALGVDARVVPTGVTSDGDAQIPRDGDVVGWYQFGSTPGDERGSAVLVGHRDTRSEGPGALFELDRLKPGARIRIDPKGSRDQGGPILRYRVVALQSREKSGLPSRLFRRTGPHQLVVITCGGPYLADAGGYQDNLFAIAVPVGVSK